MIIVTYRSYSKLLKKSFVNEKQVNNMGDFTLFARALNLDYEIISTKEIAQ
jgi:hypothetical protein